MIVYVVVTGFENDSPTVTGVFTTTEAAKDCILSVLPKDAKKCEECGDYWESGSQYGSYEPFEIDKEYYERS